MPKDTFAIGAVLDRGDPERPVAMRLYRESQSGRLHLDRTHNITLENARHLVACLQAARRMVSEPQAAADNT